MIQINLIPDVKREYLHARRTRDIAVSVSILVSIGAAGVVGIMLLFLSTQAAREYLADLTIKNEYETLSGVENLTDMVTIENQLSLISQQHAKKSMDSRLFSILQAVNPVAPNQVAFTTVTLDPVGKALTLEGQTAGGYSAFETLVKTIQNTNITYKLGGEGDEITSPIASEVIPGDSSYGIDSDNARVLRFELTVMYTDGLFDNTMQRIQIVAPARKVDVTDSKLRVPDSLFTVPATDEEEVTE